MRPAIRSVMLAAILVPFWTNVLIRCYAWIIILQKSGLANSLLVNSLHVFTQPLPLLFNLAAVLIGLVHYLIPVTILVLYTSMQRIDLRLVQAAKGLGANPLRAFLSVFFPLSLPGVYAASMLVFVIALGFFVTPALLGGPQEMTVAMQVSTYFTDTVDWGLGSALGDHPADIDAGVHRHLSRHPTQVACADEDLARPVDDRPHRRSSVGAARARLPRSAPHRRRRDRVQQLRLHAVPAAPMVAALVQ